MRAPLSPGGPAGATKGVVRPHPTHRELEEFAIARLGVTKANGEVA